MKSPAKSHLKEFCDTFLILDVVICIGLVLIWSGFWKTGLCICLFCIWKRVR